MDLLARLSEAFGPSGREDDVRALLLEALQGAEHSATVDSMGNLLVERDAAAGPRALVCAHMDEVALIVDHIDDQGFLRFKKVGGIDDRILPSTWVKVGQRRVRGVIGAKPNHLLKGDEGNQTVPSDDLCIDLGVTSKDEALELASIGDYACFDTPFSAFGDQLLRGKALDDRAGCYMALCLAKEEPALPTTFAFTVQEEIGLRGAQIAAYRVNPDFALVLETTTCADMPDPDDRRRSTRLGAGPALTFQDATSIPHPGLLRRLVETAEREGIPYQWKQTTAGGNDAGSIHKARAGIPTVTISLPCRYLHSPCSVLHQDDLEHGIQLARAFLRSVAHDGLPA